MGETLQGYRYRYELEEPSSRIVYVKIFPGMISKGFNLQNWAANAIEGANERPLSSIPDALKQNYDRLMKALSNLQSGLEYLERTQRNWSFEVVMNANMDIKLDEKGKEILSMRLITRKIGPDMQLVGRGTGGLFQYDPTGGSLYGIRWDKINAQFEVTGMQGRQRAAIY